MLNKKLPDSVPATTCVHGADVIEFCGEQPVLGLARWFRERKRGIRRTEDSLPQDVEAVPHVLVAIVIILQTLVPRICGKDEP